ncbi:DUF2375 domain-containing protein [Parashewanella curva]|uniref:DUF2375 domain-containing protein n=1 Tax=Parashewanella curva TaxID=2338552 RepID=A0A3L8PWZ4_9GAMM|nr:DUF2375 family protein [Parashewanella curva]RLV59133.1 DUF2375 domain-containing protein [Parashewanella curva]
MAQSNITPKTATVTVTYLDERKGDKVYRLVMHEMPVSDNGRVILPDDFRRNKHILTVFNGVCDLLNGAGERQPFIHAANQ